MEPDLSERLKSVASDKRMVRIVRSLPGEPYENGFVVGVGEELVLLHQFHDFYPEGYTAMLLEDIQDIRCEKRNQLFRNIIRSEGICTDYSLEHIIDLRSVELLMKSLFGRYDFVILECESRVWAEEDDYYIGRILSVDEERTVLKCFDSEGVWDSRSTSVQHRDVSKIEFDSPYINLFSRHLEGKLERKPGRD